jgi:hypothetical protein
MTYLKKAVFLGYTLLVSVACQRQTVWNIDLKLAESVGGTHGVTVYKNELLGDSCLLYGNFYTALGEKTEGNVLNIDGKIYDGDGYNNPGNFGTYRVKLKPGKHKILAINIGYRKHPVILKLAKKDSVNLSFWLTENNGVLH